MRNTGSLIAGMISIPALLLVASCIVEDDPAQFGSSPTPSYAEASPTPSDDLAAPDGHTCPANQVPSSNHWTAYAAPEDLEGTGWGIGDTLPNFTLVDQFGDEVSLYQFYGMVIMVEVGAVWCTYCNETAAKSQSLLNSYSEDCVMFLYLLTQDEFGGEVSQADVEYWAETYELDYPVLGDFGEEISNDFGVKAYPMFYFIDREMVLRSKTMGSGNYREITKNIDVLL